MNIDLEESGKYDSDGVLLENDKKVMLIEDDFPDALIADRKTTSSVQCDLFSVVSWHTNYVRSIPSKTNPVSMYF